MRSRRSRKRNGKKISRSAVLLLVATGAVFAGGIFFLLHSSSLSSRASNSQRIELEENPQFDAIVQSPRNSFVPDAPRVIYPYSVVPGGVRSPEELQSASARDRVVSEHYAGFDFRKARVIKVKEARLVYLSYRIGDQIYWTAKKVSLHAGENLITDGKLTARTRCGNQVSALPQKKTSSQEPTMAQFDGPIGISTRDPFPENFHSALESRPGPEWGTPALGLRAYLHLVRADIAIRRRISSDWLTPGSRRIELQQ